MLSKMKFWMALVMPVMALLMGGCRDNSDEWKMATDLAFPPYGFYREGEMVGIDIDIVREIEQRYHKKIIIEDMSFDEVIPSVEAGKVDFAVAGITVTPERREMVNFTRPYARAVQVIIVREGSPIDCAEKLIGMSVGVQRGTTGDVFVSRNIGKPERFAGAPEAIQALLAQKVDAVVLDNAPAKMLTEEKANLRILPEPLTMEEYAFAVNKDRPDLLEFFNRALNALAADGTLSKIENKYMKEQAGK